MNFRRLEYFSVLAQTGNLRKASEMLNLSAPALSKAMKTLEEELEVSLWVRDGRKIILTDAGKALLKRTPHFLDEMRSLKDDLVSEKKGPRPIRIGTFEVFSTYFLGFMDRLKWNDHSLELHELLPGEVEKYVGLGEIDIGITYMPVPDPDLDFLKVTSIEMGVFTRRGAFKGVPQMQLPFVIPATPLQSTPTKVRGLDGWPEDAYRRKVMHKVTLLESALELCRQGRVAGYFPVFVVDEHNKRVSDEFALERRKSPYAGRVCRSDVYIVKRKSDEETDTVKQIAKAIRLICR
ncbi:MAG: LysR family transcriptional regulator [Bdellovibrionota bacterium]